jgi:hypothetical protein
LVTRQFDVCRVVGLRDGSAVDLGLILQDDTLSDLATRIVAPLIEIDSGLTGTAATPEVEVDGQRFIIAMHLMTALSSRNLGRVIVNLESEERRIKNALDLLFFGI